MKVYIYWNYYDSFFVIAAKHASITMMLKLSRENFVHG